MAVLTYKCPNCAGEILFNPNTQQYECPYCMSHFTESELQKISQEEHGDSQPKQEDSQPDASQEAMIYNCPSCGAEIITDETTAATFCYYCHNPVILSGKLDGNFLPNKIVPFMIDKQEAIQLFFDWIKSKKFVPKQFFSKDQIDKITGIYFPYWVMDCDVKVDAQAKANKIRVWETGDIEYTETNQFDVVRKGAIHFEDLSKNALQKANKKLVEGVMPFQTLKMQPFTMGYLTGFQAEKRDMEQADLQQAMDDEMNKYADIILRESISGYSTVQMEHLELTAEHSSWEYVLLPVWVLTYQKSGKFYYYAMNGQTKKICGELPVDYKKLCMYCGIIAF
ncbi:MAG: TFIIB-type zinc ribbon-containing protein, partial [Lachnospiraceae bacterium]